MRVLFDIGHPAHFHLFKNVIRMLKSDGNQVRVIARDKEITTNLLCSGSIPFENRGSTSKSTLKKAFGMPVADLRIYRVAKEFRPDILVGVHNPYIAQVAWFLKKPSVIFNDTENAGLARKLTYPFATAICTPCGFKEYVDKKKHVKINGYKELAYLHPDNFTPDEGIFNYLGIDQDEKYIIVRFISWGASHDRDLKGLNEESKQDFIEELENYGRVFVSSEKKTGKYPEKYQINIPPSMMHSALYYSSMYIGEGGTMAAEAAVLGTPAIHIESASDGTPSGSICGNFCELRDKYGLMYFFANEKEALQKASEIMKNPNSDKLWAERRELMLKEKIDVAKWLLNFIENYPESFHQSVEVS